jgi:hypothetical protein
VNPLRVFSGADELYLRPYQWYTRAIAEGRKQSILAMEKHAEWYNNLGKMEAGEILPKSVWRIWYKQLWIFANVINVQTTLLLSTSNNIGGISADYTGWNNKMKYGGMIIMDEAGFEQEYSALVPASCGHQMLSLVGDHGQLQPIVSHRGPFAEQTSLSLFERFVEHMDIDYITLKCTYRIH